jgi:hypothetical protein
MFNAARNAIHAKCVLARQHFRSHVLFHAHTARQHFINVIQNLFHLKKKGKLAMGSNFGLGQRLEYGVISSEKRKKEKREE